MSSRAQVYFLALMLIGLGGGLVVYKSQLLGLPFIPGTYETVWTVEAKVEFKAQGRPVKVSLALPKSQNNMDVVNEVFSSSGYGFDIESEGGHKRAVWTQRQVSGSQALYYKLDVYQRDQVLGDPSTEFSLDVAKPDWSGTRRAAIYAAALALIKQARQLSSDQDTFTLQLLKLLNNKRNADAALIHNDRRESEYIKTVLNILSLANVPAHMIRGLYLEDDRSRLPPVDLIEIYNGKSWTVFNPLTTTMDLPNNFLIWQRGDKSLLDVEGGRNSQVTFSVLANDVPMREASINRMGDQTAAIVDYSIYSLPIEQQSIFKFILLVPVGALIVIVLRVMVGLRTAGTFMPVLLSIAFVQTTLVTGVSIFLLILAVGLWTRSYLSRLDLLLVSRIAAVIVIVVGMMALISIFSYKLGIEQALTITFFPMIILAWTIEHMSILWEDDGPLEVLIQTAGSLLVAVISYLAITNNYVEHWMFNFPELLLVLLGLIIILGNYTGYRLSELVRFRHMSTD